MTINKDEIRIQAFLLTFLILMSISGKGQISDKVSSRDLLNKLEIELRFEEKEIINATDVLDCDVAKIDATIQIRKNQANAQIVLRLLEKIAYARDTNSINSLSEIYDEYVKYFSKEWEVLFTKKYIENCEASVEQYQILLGFEETLHSLHLERMNLSSKEKYKYHKNLYLAYNRMHDQIGKIHIDTILLNIPYFFEYTKNIRKNYWWAHRIEFEYILPHLEDIEEKFIEDFAKFRFEENFKNRKRTFEEHYFLTNIPVIGRINNPKLDELIIDKFDYYTDYPIARLYRIAQYRNNPKLIYYLLTQLLHNPKVNHEKYTRDGRGYLFRSMLSDINTAIVEDYLLNAVEETEKAIPARSEMLFSLSELKTTSVLDRMEAWLTQPSFFTEEERKLATDVKNSIAYYLKANKK